MTTDADRFKHYFDVQTGQTMPLAEAD